MESGVGGGFSALNIPHPTGFPTPLRNIMAPVQELPSEALAQGLRNRGGLGLGSWGNLSLLVVSGEASLSSGPGPPWQRGRGFFSFSRSWTRLTANLKRIFFPQTKNLDFRRKWDKDEYEKLAEKRLTEEREKKDGGYLLHRVLTVEAMQWLEGGWGVEMRCPPYFCNIWQIIASLVLDFFRCKVKARWIEVLLRCFPAL